jgi:hypothetical protein
LNLIREPFGADGLEEVSVGAIEEWSPQDYPSHEKMKLSAVLERRRAGRLWAIRDEQF